MWDQPIDLPLTFLTNLSEIPTGCLFFQLSLSIDVPQMLDDVRARCLKQRCHLLLAQPHRLAFHTYIDACLPLNRLIDDDRLLRLVFTHSAVVAQHK